MPRPQVAMTLGRRSASQAWNAVANFTQGEVQARWWNSRQPRRQWPLMSRWEGQPVKADDLARWVAAFQVDSEGVLDLHGDPSLERHGQQSDAQGLPIEA